MMHQKLILPLAKLYQIVDKKKSEAIDWQLKTENVARPVFSFSIQFFLVITETNDMTASNQFNNVSFWLDIIIRRAFSRRPLQWLLASFGAIYLDCHMRPSPCHWFFFANKYFWWTSKKQSSFFYPHWRMVWWNGLFFNCSLFHNSHFDRTLDLTLGALGRPAIITTQWSSEPQFPPKFYKSYFHSVLHNRKSSSCKKSHAPGKVFLKLSIG